MCTINKGCIHIQNEVSFLFMCQFGDTFSGVLQLFLALFSKITLDQLGEPNIVLGYWGLNQVGSMQGKRPTYCTMNSSPSVFILLNLNKYVSEKDLCTLKLTPVSSLKDNKSYKLCLERDGHKEAASYKHGGAGALAQRQGICFTRC